MREFEVNIPSPCSADWDKMTPDSEGRFCSSCSKVVVDFTQMSGEDIQVYFKERIGQKVCGHFRTEQVKDNVSSSKGIHNYFLDMYTRVESSMRFALVQTVLLFLCGLVLTMMGCKRRTTGETTGKCDPKINNERTLTGDTVYMPIDTAKVPTIDTTGSQREFLKGEVYMEDEK